MTRSFGIAWGVVVGAIAVPLMALNMETVPVGNPGNAGESSGGGPRSGGYGPVRICGQVNYKYNIGKYEVTAGQYTEFLNAIAKADPYHVYTIYMDRDTDPPYVGRCNIKRSGTWGNYTYSVPADYADRPVRMVNWGDAARFVNWLHNGQPTGAQDATTTEDGVYDLSATHPYYVPGDDYTDYLPGLDIVLLTVERKANWSWAIPSEDEWYKAAYHKNDGVTGNYYDYPTSNDSVPSNVFGDPTDPGNNATFACNNGCQMVHTIGYPYYYTEVGAHENSESPYGTFDQGGNVIEWNEAIVMGSIFYRPLRGVRGGGVGSYDIMLRALYRDSLDYSPMFKMDNIGFRVVKASETPCNMPMMDINGDLHVDAVDFDFFSACYNGPANNVDVNCQCMDSNSDQYVDADDFDAFSNCYNGPTNPPGCS